MCDKITYIISSRDGINSVVIANNLTLVLNSLPTQHRKYLCFVKLFILNIASVSVAIKISNSQIYSGSNAFINYNELMSGNRMLNVVAVCDTVTGLNNVVNISFVIDNFNGKLIDFTLYDTQLVVVNVADCNLNVNTAWTLILELSPLCC